ncbi:MAG: F420-dependent oxidoreductase, family, partial [Frankiales bacterium]|nr:F420-dependent oxidoreductase, family [Frankiales bacterium]
MTKLGYFLSSEELSPSELLRAAQLAEKAGFERVWVSDHYHPWMSQQGESPFVWGVIGAIAATTSLEITTAVTCPTYRIHPAVLAQATATSALLAPGRFRFGIGSGEALNEHILGDPWPPVSVRLERLEEAVDVIRQLWTGKTITHEGKHFTVHNARLFSVPDEPPPIYLSGFGPEATELAARIADGWISTKPDTDNLQLFRKTNDGVTQGGTKICWATTEGEAAETAYRLWGHQGQGGQATQDLPMWESFEALA